MVICKIENLESVITSVRQVFAGNDDALTHITNRCEIIKAAFNVDLVSYCLERYISAELDCETPGNRGIGRLTETIPRLGAYYRKQISELHDEEKSKLYFLIQQVMLGGYLAHAIFMDEPRKYPGMSSSEDVFERWIPAIYGSDASTMDNNILTALEVCTTFSLKMIKDFFKEHNMKFSGHLSEDKTDAILIYYAIAGFGIRFVEVGNDPRRH